MLAYYVLQNTQYSCVHTHINNAYIRTYRGKWTEEVRDGEVYSI